MPEDIYKTHLEHARKNNFHLMHSILWLLAACNNILNCRQRKTRNVSSCVREDHDVIVPTIEWLV